MSLESSSFDTSTLASWMLAGVRFLVPCKVLYTSVSAVLMAQV